MIPKGGKFKGKLSLKRRASESLLGEGSSNGKSQTNKKVAIGSREFKSMSGISAETRAKLYTLLYRGIDVDKPLPPLPPSKLVQDPPPKTDREGCDGSPRPLLWTSLPPPNLAKLTRKPVTLEQLLEGTSVHGGRYTEHHKRSDPLRTSTKADVEGEPVGEVVDVLGQSSAVPAVNHGSMVQDGGGYSRTEFKRVTETGHHPTTQCPGPEANMLAKPRRESYDNPNSHGALSAAQSSRGPHLTTSSRDVPVDGSTVCPPTSQTSEVGVSSTSTARACLGTRGREEIDGNAVSMMAAQERGKDSISSLGSAGKPSVVTSHKPSSDLPCSTVRSPNLLSPDPTAGDYVDPCDDLTLDMFEDDITLDMIVDDGSSDEHDITLDMIVDDGSSDEHDITLDMIMDDGSSDENDLPPVKFAVSPQAMAVTPTDPLWTGGKWKRDEGMRHLHDVMSVSGSHGGGEQAKLVGRERGRDDFSTSRPGAELPSTSGKGREGKTDLQLPDSCPMCNMWFPQGWSQLEVDKHVARCLDMDINEFIVLD